MTMATPLALETRALTMQFGGLKAVSDLELEVPEGMIFGLIGPNGAGKTTVFNMLTGIYRPTAGSIRSFGHDLVGLKPYQVVTRGLARTFQNIRLFKDLTVFENVQIGMDHHPGFPRQGFIPSIFRMAKVATNEQTQEREIERILEVFGLEERQGWLAKNLPYGDQRRLEIARAMATGARVLLLDEPAAGMNAGETAALMATIRKVRDRTQATILLIEHDMKLVMGICERIAVLDYGLKIAEGTPSEIQKNPRVIEAYLGMGGKAGKAATQNG